jgi:hypothetical protein
VSVLSKKDAQELLFRIRKANRVCSSFCILWSHIDIESKKAAMSSLNDVPSLTNILQSWTICTLQVTRDVF